MLHYAPQWQQKPLHFDQPNQSFKLEATAVIAHLTIQLAAKCHFCLSAPSQQHVSLTTLVMKPFYLHALLGISHFHVTVQKEKKFCWNLGQEEGPMGFEIRHMGISVGDSCRSLIFKCCTPWPV